MDKKDDRQEQVALSGSIFGTPHSYLVVPALRAERYYRHLSEDVPTTEWPHAVIFDLEDSIAPHAKCVARQALREFAKTLNLNSNDCHFWIRINPADSKDWNADLESISPLLEQGFGLALTKTRSSSELDRISKRLPALPRHRILPAIETLDAYATRRTFFRDCSNRQIPRVVIGGNDLACLLNVHHSYTVDVLRTVVSELLVAGAEWGVGLIDSPSVALPGSESWQKVVQNEASWAAVNGAVGKIAIHPDQVALINEVFERHDTSRREHSKRILSLFESGSDVVAMVTPDTRHYMGTPSLKAATRLLGHKHE